MRAEKKEMDIWESGEPIRDLVRTAEDCANIDAMKSTKCVLEDRASQRFVNLYTRRNSDEILEMQEIIPSSARMISKLRP